MMIRPMRNGMLAAALMLAIAAATDAHAQAGRYAVEYEGATMGGVTGVGAKYTAGGSLVIELPPVVASYPTVRFVRAAGAPDRAMQIPVGTSAGESFQVRFTHPDLSGEYIGESGTVRIRDVADGRISGDFVVVASPAADPGARTLTFRGSFEAVG
jgi:hypothetical protein